MRFRLAIALAGSLLLLTVACQRGSEPDAGDSFLAEGDRAPDFTLPSVSGDRVALADFKNHKPVLLYFSMGPG